MCQGYERRRQATWDAGAMYHWKKRRVDKCCATGREAVPAEQDFRTQDYTTSCSQTSQTDLGNSEDTHVPSLYVHAASPGGTPQGPYQGRQILSCLRLGERQQRAPGHCHIDNHFTMSSEMSSRMTRNFLTNFSMICGIKNERRFPRVRSRG